MKPKLVVALSSYIIPKLLGEDNPCVSINRISDGLSEKNNLQLQIPVLQQRGSRENC